MAIKFKNLDEKEEWIEEHSIYDEEEDVEYYICPKCKKKYEDFDEAVDCCYCVNDESGDFDDGDDY